MKREAYNHAERGDFCAELDALWKIERFGLEAITGRKQFFFGELRRMIAAENIVNAYNSRAAAENWAEWTQKNPMLARILADVEINDANG